MSIRAILGLLGLNLWLLVVGNAVLFGLRGWRSWGEVGRLLGLGYMLGVATLGMLWVWQLTLKIELTRASIFATGIVVAATGVVAGIRFGRQLPSRSGLEIRLPRISLVSAVLGGLTIAYFEALFRAGRLAGLYEFDAWLFWVPKAQAIYSFGGLDSEFVRELPNAAYPPLVPALEAAAFHFMGSADVVTLHLQFWFLLVGFVSAVVGLLAGKVPPLLLWVPLLLVLVAPHVVEYALQPQADFLLDELFALAVLLVALWLIERADWMIVAAAPLLGAAMLTKREGYMFAACLVASALIATIREARVRWAKLILVGALAAAATVPWWLFLKLEDIGSRGTESGGSDALSNVGRVWPSLKLALSTVFDFDIWLLTIPVLLLAIAVAAGSSARLLPSFAALLFVFCVGGLTWSTWAFPSFPVTKEAALNPIVRVSGGLVLSGALLIPLLLAPSARLKDLGSMTGRVVPVALLLAAACLYPVGVLAGGAPRFPHRSECVRPAKQGAPIEAVFGHFRDRAAASAQLRHVLAVGFEGSKIVMDGCGVLKVVVQGIPTLAVGRDFQKEARTVDLHPTLEQGMP